MFKIILQRDCFKTCNEWAKWQGLSVDIRTLSTKVVCPSPGTIYMYKSIKIYTRTRCQRWAFTGPLVLWLDHSRLFYFAYWTIPFSVKGIWTKTSVFSLVPLTLTPLCYSRYDDVTVQRSRIHGKLISLKLRPVRSSPVCEWFILCFGETVLPWQPST